MTSMPETSNKKKKAISITTKLDDSNNVIRKTVNILLPGDTNNTPATLPEVEYDSTNNVETNANREKILLVEDDPRILKFTSRCFDELGFDVVTATNADEAKVMLELNDNNITCLLTDIRMPGSLDGRDLAIWARSSIPHVKVAVTTGFEDSKKELQQDFQVLRKPYSLDDLSKFVYSSLLELH